MLEYCFKKGVFNLPYPPEMMQIELTNICNLKCIMCRQSIPGSVREKGFMDMQLFSKIVEDAKDKVFLLQFVISGEPLLHDKIIDMIKLARSYSIKTNIHTNAVLLDERLSEELINSGLDEISFSFDTADQKLYERNRFPAKFQDTLENIMKFLKTKERLKKESPLVMMQNLQEFKETSSRLRLEAPYKDLFKGLPVKFFVKHYTNPAGKFTKDNFDLGPPEEFFKPKGKKYNPCKLLWKQMSVGWDGKALGCCDDFLGEYILGDLNQQSIMEVWNGQGLVSLREKLFNGDYHQIELCRNCPSLWS